MFANTLDLVDDCGLTYLHVFPFSPRTGTPAARMPQVARAAVKERAARLRAKGCGALRASSRLAEGPHDRGADRARWHRARARILPRSRLPLHVQPGTLAKAYVTSHDGRRLSRRGCVRERRARERRRLLRPSVPRPAAGRQEGRVRRHAPAATEATPLQKRSAAQTALAAADPPLPNAGRAPRAAATSSGWFSAPQGRSDQDLVQAVRRHHRPLHQAQARRHDAG